MTGNLQEKAGSLLETLRDRRPMIHHLTNMVVMNFTANVTLALGAAPVMAPCEEEVKEMVSMAGALLLNIGTLDPALVDSMVAAGKEAERLGIPVVLDPVGAGATRLRTEAALRILGEVPVRTLRGNAGEVLTLAGEGGMVRGVDSLEDIGEREEALRSYAKKKGMVVAVTGKTDLVTSGKSLVRVSNGHPMLARVTGTGCAASTAVACFLAAAPEEPLAATASGLAAFGLAGEKAAALSKGPGTFVPNLLDALAGLDGKGLQSGARFEVSP